MGKVWFLEHDLAGMCAGFARIILKRRDKGPFLIDRSGRALAKRVAYGVVEV